MSLDFSAKARDILVSPTIRNILTKNCKATQIFTFCHRKGSMRVVQKSAFLLCTLSLVQICASFQMQKFSFFNLMTQFHFFILEEYWIRHKVIYHSTLKVEQENQDKKGELQDGDDKGVV